MCAKLVKGGSSGWRWLRVVEIGLSTHLWEDWEGFIKGLQHWGIFLSQDKDLLIWSWNHVFGKVTTNLAYETLIYSYGDEIH